MKYGALVFLLVGAVCLGVSICGCQKQEKVVKEQEPLLLEDSEPLLLDEGDDYDGPMADNSRCHVCHINYESEKLSVTHAKAEVGCEDCHGSSDAHCGDEDNITPPDRIFAKDGIVEFCMGCHPKEKISISAHDKVFKGEMVCTDCHGEHKLEHRTRRWDKKTRELIQDDNVRMLTDEMLEK